MALSVTKRRIATLILKTLLLHRENFNLMKKNLLIALIAAFPALATAQQKPAEKEKQIESVTITKTKKAVEQKADRTIFDFSEQPQLNTGNLMEGVKKLPGLIVSDVAGMMYQGKMLDVYLDGRPLGIGGNQLQGFLEGMPANSVERVEIITQPGAEFPATSGGAIINIITNKNAKNYLSATYTGKYAFSNYDKFRSRTSNSVLLNAKNKYFGWQLNVGQNYREGYRDSRIGDITKIFTENIQRGYFMKSALSFDIGQDKLLLNYDLNRNNNDAYTDSWGFEPVYSTVPALLDYTTDDKGKTENWRHDVSATYQVKFADKAQKLDLNASYNNFNNKYSQSGTRFYPNSSISGGYNTGSDQNIATFKADYSQPVKILEEGKISVGGLFENVNFDTDTQDITNLKYKRQTAAMYAEIQQKYKKFDFTLGARAENYDISGKTIDTLSGTLTKDLIPFNKFRIFPNASVQYSFMPRVYLAFNYNKKIQLPSISSLNPNNTNYQGGNVSFGGNPNLQPTIYDNFEVKISMFDYAFIGYNYSVAENQTVQVAEKNYFFPNQPFIGGREAYSVRNSFINVASMKIHNFNAGIPVPFMIFTKGLKETMKFNFNPDKINFMYLYAGYQLHQLPDNENKGFWMFNLMAQVILPGDTKLVANYMTMTHGNYYYYRMQKPWMNSVDLTVSKKFMNDRLTVSAFANDIFRWNENAVVTLYKNSNIYLGNKFDSQNFGISVNYKIPTKNKLAKETPILLNKDKKEDTGMMPQQ